MTRRYKAFLVCGKKLQDPGPITPEYIRRAACATRAYIHKTVRHRAFTGLPAPVGEGKQPAVPGIVARVRPRTSKGITDLLLLSVSYGFRTVYPSKKSFKHERRTWSVKSETRSTKDAAHTHTRKHTHARALTHTHKQHAPQHTHLLPRKKTHMKQNTSQVHMRKHTHARTPTRARTRKQDPRFNATRLLGTRLAAISP